MRTQSKLDCQNMSKANIQFNNFSLASRSETSMMDKVLLYFLCLQKLYFKNNCSPKLDRNQFDYSGTNLTVKVGLADRPYVMCQILLFFTLVITQTDAQMLRRKCD